MNSERDQLGEELEKQFEQWETENENEDKE